MKNRILEISRLIQEKVSPPCAKKFGEYLFGEYTKWHKARKEDDTAHEQFVFGRLHFFMHNSSSMGKGKKAFEEAFGDLMACKKSYPDILQPPKGVLYRGSRLRFSDVVEIMGERNFELAIDGDLPKKNIISKSYTYIPKSKIQSWSTSWKVAEEFSTDEWGTGDIPQKTSKFKHNITIPVVYSKVMPSSEMFLSANFADTISKGENEVIRVGGKISNCNVMISDMMIFNATIRANGLKNEK